MRSKQPRHSKSPSAPRRFTKLLAANRSELAIRIFRAATDLGFHTVAMRTLSHLFANNQAWSQGKGVNQ